MHCTSFNFRQYLSKSHRGNPKTKWCAMCHAIEKMAVAWEANDFSGWEDCVNLETQTTTQKLWKLCSKVRQQVDTHTHKTRKNTSHVSFCLYSVVDSIKVLRHITCQKNQKNNDLSRTNCPLRATQVVQNVRIVQVNHLGIVLEGPSNPKLQLRRLSQKRVGHGEKTHGWTWGSLNHEFVFFRDNIQHPVSWNMLKLYETHVGQFGSCNHC